MTTNLQPGVVTRVADRYARVRQLPSEDAPILRQLRVGATVRYDPTPIPGGWYTVAGVKLNSWLALETGYVAAGVIAIEPAGAVETWTVNLDAPYVSQTDANAARSLNDCAIAALLCLIRHWFTQHGLLVPSLPTVDMLIPFTALNDRPPPNGLTFAQIGALARQLGFQTTYRQPLTPDEIARLLHEGKPVIVLVDYSVYNPAANAKIAHLTVVKGYNSAAFLTHDSYLAGADYRIAREQLSAAMKSSPGNVQPYQGMTLSV